MKYFLWPFLRVAALILLVVLTVSGLLRAALRALTGANQIPPSTFSCLLQFLTLPIFAPILLIYLTSARLHLEIMVLDVKLGFARPEEGFRVAAQTFPESYGYWYMRFFRREAEEEPSAGKAQEPAPEAEVSKAEILEEMCQLEGMWPLKGVSRLSYGEAAILAKKTLPLRLGGQVFPVTETANEEEINRWLNHPELNTPMPHPFVLNMAAHSSVPTAIMERILRKLLQEDYDMYWRIAEARVRSRNQA